MPLPPDDKQILFVKYLLNEVALTGSCLTDPTAYWTRNIIPGLIFQEFSLLSSDATVNDVIFASVGHKCTCQNTIVNIEKFS